MTFLRAWDAGISVFICLPSRGGCGQVRRDFLLYTLSDKFCPMVYSCYRQFDIALYLHCGLLMGGSLMLSMEMLLDAQRILDPVINHTPVVSTKDIVPDCDFLSEGGLPAENRRIQAPGCILQDRHPFPMRKRPGASLPALREIMPRALPLPPGIWESRPPSASRRGAPE